LKFDDLLTTAQTLPSAELPNFLGELETVRVTAMARLMAPAAVPPADAEHRVGLNEAARLLGVSKSRLYRHPPEYHRLERRDGRKLLYSASEIKKYIRQGH
jgi:hypothetical protein